MASSEAVLQIDGREVPISHPNKVYFPTRGETKLDLLRHYLRLAEPLMRAVGDRCSYSASRTARRLLLSEARARFSAAMRRGPIDGAAGALVSLPTIHPVGLVPGPRSNPFSRYVTMFRPGVQGHQLDELIQGGDRR